MWVIVFNQKATDSWMRKHLGYSFTDFFNEQDFGHKSEVLKQGSPGTFEADTKVETESLVEPEQETEPKQLRHTTTPSKIWHR